MPTTPTDGPVSIPTPDEGEITLGRPKSGLNNALSDEAYASVMKSLSGGAGVQAPVNTEGEDPSAPPPALQPAKAAATTPPTPKPEEGKAPTPAKAVVAAVPAEETLVPPEEVAKLAPKPLREAYERAAARLAKLEASGIATNKQLAEAHARVAAHEEKLGTYEKRFKEEFEPLKAMHEQTAKQLQESLETIKRTNYTAHPEWHEKHTKPIVEVTNEAVQFISELTAKMPDGSIVPATKEHLDYIVSAPNSNEAAVRAEQFFGNQPIFTGPLVNYRTRLKALSIKREEAFKNATLEAEEWHKQKTLREAQYREQMVATIAQREQQALAAIQVGEDAELRGALDEGRTLADRLVNGAPNMTPDAWADTVAQSRVAIQERNVLKKQMARMQAEKAALESELAKYRTSEPQVETRSDPTPPVSETVLDSEEALKADLEQRFRKIATARPR